MNSRGVALITVLAFILAVVVLANIALALIVSQARFTLHKVSRINAFYAAQAGINYAIERLRTGDWTAPTTKTLSWDPPCDVEDDDLKYKVDIDIGNPGSGINGTTPVSATATYTFSSG